MARSSRKDEKKIRDVKDKNEGKPSQREDVSVPPELIQRVLDVFVEAFSEQLGSEAKLRTIVQEVKGHLYERDFGAAFGKQEYLEAYAVRWSAARALGYLGVLMDVVRDMDGDGVLCLGGGGGAEVAALAGVCRALERSLNVSVYDSGAWDTVLATLSTTFTTALSVDVKCSFHRADLLDLNMIFPSSPPPALTTLFFTLNELYTVDRRRTNEFLAALTMHLPRGALFLVLDSPGSYSSVSLASKRSYPMAWLLDHALLHSCRDSPLWEKLHEDTSRWFRLPQGLRYPIDLENMRFQMHLYRRC